MRKLPTGPSITSAMSMLLSIDVMLQTSELRFPNVDLVDSFLVIVIFRTRTTALLAFAVVTCSAQRSHSLKEAWKATSFASARGTP